MLWRYCEPPPHQRTTVTSLTPALQAAPRLNGEATQALVLQAGVWPGGWQFQPSAGCQTKKNSDQGRKWDRNRFLRALSEGAKSTQLQEPDPKVSGAVEVGECLLYPLVSQQRFPRQTTMRMCGKPRSFDAPKLRAVKIHPRNLGTYQQETARVLVLADPTG